MMTQTLMTRLRRIAARLRIGETGSLSVEAVLAIPFLLWTILGLFTLTDAFRAIHANTLSTYSLSDMLSRQTEYVTAADIEGLNALHEIVSRADGPTALRASVVYFDGNESRYEVAWSYATGERAALTDATLAEVEASIPTLGDGEAVVLVETWAPYDPLVDFLISDLEISDVVATRPRFAPTVAWSG
jgi:hypothetical protein